MIHRRLLSTSPPVSLSPCDELTFYSVVFCLSLVVVLKIIL